MKVNIITLGCSKNVVDSENVAGHLRKAGITVTFDRTDNTADVVIVNTCGFIGDAKEESVNTLLNQVEIKRRGRKQRTIIAVGCLIERYKKELQEELPEIDAYYGAHQWNELITSLTQQQTIALQNERTLSTPKHYAYLKIAEGCNRRCSYCAIPLIRGPYISRPIEQIVNEAKRLIDGGTKELIVIAQDTTYYGLDLYGKRQLGTLLNRLASESGAEWIRLHYTYPDHFPEDVIEAIATHNNICKYIDIPLQHISSNILQSMQRGIDREETLNIIAKLRKALPTAALRTTLIAGYPGETEQEFQELKQFVNDAQFDRLGVFAYSPEEGTSAFNLGDTVDEEEKQRRVGELMALQESISLQKNEARVGQTFKTIIDRKEGEYYIGRTEYDSPDVDDEVLIKATSPLRTGHFYRVMISSAMENDLLGEVVN